MKSIKFLLSRAWAKNFFNEKAGQYFLAKKLIDCEIKLLKVYFNYRRMVVKYRLKLLDKEKNIFEKEVAAKAEQGPSREILNDFLTTKFLWQRGLNDLVARPLEYLSSFNLYLYEFIPGYFLQALSNQRQDQKFLAQIPRLVKALKRFHQIEVTKKDNFVNQDRKSEARACRRELRLVKRFWPAGFDKISFWQRRCQFLRNKYEKYFLPEFHQLTHGDFYSRNILINNRQIKLLDFSNSSAYEPMNDLGNFLINTELMFEYDFPKSYPLLMKKLKTLLFQNYFSRPMTAGQEFKINYFVFRNLIRIIALVARSEASEKLPQRPGPTMEKLIRFGEAKYLILKGI